MGLEVNQIMKLRQLHKKDTPLILEWMKDSEINHFFRFDPNVITIESIAEFIEKAMNSQTDRHYAIVDDNDTYLGTISLKNIDYLSNNAEYAISLRKSVIGTGVAFFATKELLKIAFYKLKLHKVYLNVLSDNIRAIIFYEKMGFVFEGEFVDHLFIRDQYRSLKWYAIVRQLNAK